MIKETDFENSDLYKHLNEKKGVMVESTPPFIIDGRRSIVNFGINYDKKIMTISHHTLAENETNNEKIRHPEDVKTVSFPFEHLMWLAPRLEGMRQHLGIESGYEKYAK